MPDRSAHASGPVPEWDEPELVARELLSLLGSISPGAGDATVSPRQNASS
jgi:hypothetical protein